MSPDIGPSLRDGTRSRILGNLNGADIIDNLRRGPKHWSNVAGELLLAFLDSRLATNAHLRYMDRLQDGGLLARNIAPMDTLILRHDEVGFAGKAKRVNFGSKQLRPHNPQNDAYLAEFNSALFDEHGSIDHTVPRIHILGPTSRDQEYNNGVIYRDKNGHETGEIPDFKGGIEIHSTEGVSVLSPQDIQMIGLREGATALFGVSQFIQTCRGVLQVSDAELFEMAIGISQANGYMVSYNTRFGFLADLGQSLAYYVVRTNEFLIHDLYNSFKATGGELIDGFELVKNRHMSRYVPFGNYLLLKALQTDTTLHPDQEVKLAGLEEHYLSVPIVVKPGQTDIGMASGFHLVYQG